MFHYPVSTGLPIGNLTSQVFGNVYLNSFDHFVKHKLGIKYYGRYVDDMVFIHNDKQFLVNCISRIQEELNKVGVKIHPRKNTLRELILMND